MSGETTDLGDLGGDPAPEVDFTFGWFGRTIRVRPELSELSWVDFLDGAANLSRRSTAGMLAIKGFLRRMVVHPDDWESFWGGALEARRTVDDLVEVIHAVIEAATGRPTVLPSDSSSGQQTTQENSEAEPSSAADIASARARRRLEEEGRPDLAEQHLVAAAARRAAGSKG
jgi:hypothetical protein